MKILNITLFISLLLLFGSCCDCPLEPNQNPIYDCLVREASITVFEPGLVVDNTTDPPTITPVPEYSIHTFQFPNDDNSSGLLTNDDRFADQENIVIASVPYSNGEPYSVAILDDLPLNISIRGDILVVSTDPVGSTAQLRFAGRLARLPQTFNSENADQFCSYIDNNTNVISDAADNASLYGAADPLASINDFSAASIEIINANGEVVTGEAGVPAPLLEDINQLRNITGGSGIDIQVEPGDAFYYEARNGKSFVVIVVDVFEGILSPFKRRVTIMFNPLD